MFGGIRRGEEGEEERGKTERTTEREGEDKHSNHSLLGNWAFVPENNGANRI